MPQLQKSATRRIYEVSEANALDPVGFGKFSTLTYGQLRREQPGYAQWVQETLLEGGNAWEYRLIRLGTWLMNQTDEDYEEELVKDTPSTAAPARPPVKVGPFSKAKALSAKGAGRDKGYATASAAAVKETPATSSTAEPNNSVSSEQIKLMMDTMVAMKEEIKQLRENQGTKEPRRKKKDEAETASTDQSFALVMDP